MKSRSLVSFFVLLAALSFSGCASKFVDVLAETDQAIQKAQKADAEKKCPKEFQEVRKMREQANETFWTCKSQEAMKLAKTATEKANALCPKPTDGPDKDGDGIPDALDGCPDKAEDKDGFLDNDGCPDLDHDFDGVLDVNDKCPKEAEDKDGFLDEDGCPDPDNDGDGILDVKDKCPNKPETFNGYQDEDGCPDELPARVIDELPVRMILEGVNFATNSAKLETSSVKALKIAANTLTQNPSLTVRIEGHTDNVGSDDSNKGLSQRRAESVKNFLVAQYSISPDRISTAGFGEAHPIASNDTPEGRAKNRRIEFVITGGNPAGRVKAQ